MDGLQVNLEEISQGLKLETLRCLLKVTKYFREFAIDLLNMLHAAIIKWPLLAVMPPD